MERILRSIGLILLICAAGLAPIAAMAGGDGSDAVVVFAPGVTRAEAYTQVAAAGGRIVGLGSAVNIVTVRTDDPAVRAALRRHGAWLIVDRAAAAGCFSDRSPNSIMTPRENR